jgi:hypothetical protein
MARTSREGGPWRAGCVNSRLGHPPERGVPFLGFPRPVDKHLTNLGAQPESDQTREPLTVATRSHELVDLDRRHTSSLTGSYGTRSGVAPDVLRPGGRVLIVKSVALAGVGSRVLH